MSVLADFILVVGEERFGVSAPAPGDATAGGSAAPERSGFLLTFGVAAADLAALQQHVGRTALLMNRRGRSMGQLRILKVGAPLPCLVVRREGMGAPPPPPAPSAPPARPHAEQPLGLPAGVPP